MLDAAQSVQSEVGVVFQNIRHYLEGMGQGSWTHYLRLDNYAAHIIAHSETRWDERVVWLDRPPIFVIDQLVKDNVILVYE
ncbi:unnamed protein product [Linum tenue]|uniref:Uncharacterized protein n=1 Tax=Linum tenue TaxID=586396 RepID=A0AAV0HFC0_9ROSI|nr:unnamed protein product [Linum tenue]